MPEGDAPEVVCRCGRRLNVRGARPGRVGRCPNCGATFRVPESGWGASAARAPERTLSRPRSRPKPRRSVEEEQENAADGYALAMPEEAEGTLGGPTPAPRNPERMGDSRTPRTPIEPVGRGGIWPLPKTPEATALGSLLYPVWDGFGLAWMIALPPVLTVGSLCVFGLIPMVMKGGAVALFGPIAFAMIAVLLLSTAYLLTVLQSVLIASAQGDLHHPGWPDVELGSIAVALFRWSVVFGIGVGPSVYAATRMLGEVPESGMTLGQVLMVGAVGSMGGVYALAALIAVCLHEDVRAVNPTIVVPAIYRLGLAYLAPVGFWFLYVEGMTLAVRGLYHLPGFGSLLVTTWGVWVLGLYGALVLMRLLGRAYQRKARRVGWFRTRRRRREEPMEPGPRVPIPEL